MDELSKSELLAKIEGTWNTLMSFLDGLTPEQREQRTDAAGWTVKDHAIHNPNSTPIVNIKQSW